MKHNYIKVKLLDYNRFLSENNHNRLDKWNRIEPNISSLPNFIKVNEEILDGIETIYDINSHNNSYIVEFESKSGNKYRFDILKDPNDEVYHLAFSESKNDISSSNYESLTFKEEAIEVFSRLSWILRDISNKYNINYFCIGGTNDDRKNKIYEYMLRFVSGWERRKSSQYDLGWAIYFKL